MNATAPSLVPRLEKLLGSSEVVAAPADLAVYEVDGVTPAAAARPATPEQAAAAIRFAAAEKLAVIPCSGRTKLRIGAPPQRYDFALDVSRMNRVLAYDPGDLTLGVEPGVRFSELSGVLAEKKQFLPLAPAFFHGATIGGLIGANMVSPLRYAYGPARDFVLGMEFVTGEGVLAKAGGRVVKNVTGYDLHKLLIGSLGTLGVITRVNFRTFPIPPTQETTVTAFADAQGALTFCRAIRQSPLEPRLVEVLDPRAARIAEPQPKHLLTEKWSVVVASAGMPAAVERYRRDLSQFAEQARAASFQALSDAEKWTLLGNVREFVALSLKTSPWATILRAQVLPASVGPLLARLRETSERNDIPSASLVRAMGVVYHVLLPRGAEAQKQIAKATAELLQACTSAEIGGRAMIEWCPTAWKPLVNIWGPPSADVELMRGLKRAFDPQNVLSPGRFAGGI
jgi:glycolate oxidase FAD binding subunit